MEPLMPVWQLALVALASSAACSFLVWIVSVARHNAALADRVWSVLIMVSAVVFALGLPPLRQTVAVVLLLGAAWAMRLSLFITWRSWGILKSGATHKCASATSRTLNGRACT